MRTAILTIPDQQHRIWALMGHLYTLGFPVRHPENHIGIYNGFNYRDYKTGRSVVEAMIEDGHVKYKEAINFNHLDGDDSHYEVCEWGLLNIMREIIKMREPVLVLENDAFFRNLPVSDIEDAYDFINQLWKNLVDKVGYEHINVAMFTVIRPDLDELKSNKALEPIDDFWVKGACGPGQTANIYTPHGAEYILNKKPPYPNIESFLYYGSDKASGSQHMPNIYSSKRGIISLHFINNFDSPHVKRDAEQVFKFYSGVQL